MKGKLMKLLAMCCLLSTCTGTDTAKQAEYQRIDAQKAKEMMQDSSVIVLDVRTQEEYAQGHIPNAELLPLDQIEKISEVAEKDKTILIYCRSGNRSAQAAHYLIESGYENVYDFGGILSWPYEIE